MGQMRQVAKALTDVCSEVAGSQLMPCQMGHSHPLDGQFGQLHQLLQKMNWTRRRRDFAKLVVFVVAAVLCDCVAIAGDNAVVVSVPYHSIIVILLRRGQTVSVTVAEMVVVVVVVVVAAAAAAFEDIHEIDFRIAIVDSLSVVRMNDL